MRENKQEYWVQKAKDILEEMYPKKHRKLKKDGMLDEAVTTAAKTACEKFERMHDWLKVNRLPQTEFNTENPTPDEISTVNYENIQIARDEATELLTHLLAD